MTDDAAILHFLDGLGLVPRAQVPLSGLGYYRIGGPADVAVDVHTASQLSAIQGLGVPMLVIGKGSNLLVSDLGVRGIVVRLVGDFQKISFDQELLEAGAGAANVAVLGRLRKLKRAGGAPLAGVPGTIGGAVRMNAGTRDGELSDRLHSVELVLPSGEVERMPASALNMRYRWAELPAGAIVSRAWMRTSEEDFAAEQTSIREHLAYRKATQPLKQPSCGSVFKNPTGDSAGRLIDATGLKGARVGGARVSELHANWIVNTGEARADDVRRLVEEIQAKVEAEHGVRLEPEVHAVGDWETPPSWL